MRKKVITYLLLVTMLCVSLGGCGEKSSGTDVPEIGKEAETSADAEKPVKVTLNEVAHSIFYAPQYVAIQEGYFAEEGIELTLVTGFGVRNLVQDGLKKIHIINGIVGLQMNLLNTALPE